MTFNLFEIRFEIKDIIVTSWWKWIDVSEFIGELLKKKVNIISGLATTILF